MKRKLLSLILGSFCLFTTAQESLSDQLYGLLEKDIAYFELDNLEEQRHGLKIINDRANGYLYINTGEPDSCCDLASEFTVAAFKDAEGRYTILKTGVVNCNFESSFSANKSLNKILPSDFSLESFIPTYSKMVSDSIASFHPKFYLPRNGTDIKVELAVIPIGIRMDKNKLFSYEYFQFDRFKTDKKSQNFDFNSIKTLASKIADNQLLLQYVAGSESLIPEVELEKINSILEDDNSKQELRRLKRLYDLYRCIQYDTIILSWDKSAASFYIKERMLVEKKATTFLEFLKAMPYYMIAC